MKEMNPLDIFRAHRLDIAWAIKASLNMSQQTSSPILPVLERTSFAAVSFYASYLAVKSMIPPQALHFEGSKDRAGKTIMSLGFAGLGIYRNGILALSALNALAGLSGPPFTQLLSLGGRLNLNAGHIDPTWVTWNKVSATAIGVIGLSAWARLYSMNALGKDFTFDLHDPSRLNTSGIYHYVQHPSYTTAAAIVCGVTYMLERADGAAGAFMSPGLFELLDKWLPSLRIASCILMFIALRLRVVDEEKMLRDKFGLEWEAWHKKTARFVPFLF